ncbi:hypothetical protein [Pseudomonas brenneri]|uniref:hypothetical protein n=1 Tax=Pseudomonas brenneri TaxID=129817 RepID=UPI0028D78A0E|nr:hypothetical protein [Pseudomonas brenneri]
MSAGKMREAFEQFIIRRDGSIWVTVLGDKRSYNEPIERDFAVWCESRAAIEVELPKAWQTNVGAMLTPNGTRFAIESIGLKVKP